MQVVEARLTEMRFDKTGENTLAWIACPANAVPSPGRYVMAWARKEPQAPLATALFAAEVSEAGFLAAPPIPSSWMVGDMIDLQGPFGYGFEMPITLRRLALASVAGNLYRMLPLIQFALAHDAAVALYSDHPAASLPLAVEVNPLASLPDGLNWADFLALELSLSHLMDLRDLLGLHPDAPGPSVTGQVLITTPMPCVGMAECGVCALPNSNRWKLACVDGPVFDISELLRHR